MANLGKKILSAFIDIEDETPADNAEATKPSLKSQTTYSGNDASNEKFKKYFDNLFKEANLPGPDYFEFSKMIEAMSSIADEKTRYLSAFAGLSVQGLDKEKLLKSAREYISILESDSEHFNATINTALQDKVELKKKQVEEKSVRIQDLTREINDLNNQIMLLGNEIKENEEKIHNNVSSYARESERFKAKLNDDIQKINNLL